MTFPKTIAALLLSASVLSCGPAAAQLFGRGGLGNGLQTPYVPAQREPPRGNDGDAPGLSPNEAARRAQNQNGGGRVLSVEPSGPGYRVKLLRDGEVRVIYVQ